MIDYVLLQANRIKQESQQKIYLHAVVLLVVLDVMVVFQVVLGVILRKMDLLLVIFMDRTNGADLIHSHPVIIIPMDHMDHVELLNQHQNV